MAKTIQELILEADLAMVEEQEDNKPEIASKDFLTYNLPHWKRWYLKKNQPNNYFRVTQIIPPGLEKNPGMWPRKFQVWVKGKILMQFEIEADTFTHFFNAPEWEQGEHTGMKYAKLKPQLP